MVVGLIGAGNMARALARGWGDPVLCSDGGSGRARELVEELGGEAFDSNVEVARRADLVVLCHKPYQLEQVALEIAGETKAVASVLGGTLSQMLQNERVGMVLTLEERLMEAAAAIFSVGPAYQALLAEAQIDAGVRHGLRPELAGQLVAQTMAGSAALLKSRDYDTLAVRRGVTSPGGSTARGLAALEAAGIRTAFQSAIDAVILGGTR
jgi:pyrroline-5-carboxylate reductase